jgi:hypothetical protein
MCTAGPLFGPPVFTGCPRGVSQLPIYLRFFLLPLGNYIKLTAYLPHTICTYDNVNVNVIPVIIYLCLQAAIYAVGAPKLMLGGMRSTGSYTSFHQAVLNGEERTSSVSLPLVTF